MVLARSGVLVFPANGGDMIALGESSICQNLVQGAFRIQKCGANVRIRTEDLLFTKQLLYH